MSFPRYERYKDSGPTWFGRVPSHWDVLDGRRVFAQKRTASLPDDPQLSATQKYGVIPQTLFMELEQQKVVLALKGTDAFKHVEIDDFIISLRSFQGGIEKSHYRGCVSTAYTVLRNTKNIDAKYWEYLLKSPPYIDALSSVTDGIREGRSISYAQFGGLPLPFPSVCEQTAIAGFLDYETAKIDALKEEQLRLIELLKNKRQAVISHAVTKGLNPDVQMKDSRIDWVGDVPHHWTVVPVAYRYDAQLGKMLDTLKITGENLRPYLRVVDVQWDSINIDDLPLMDFDEDARCKFRLRAGDLLINEGGSYPGRTAIWSSDLECYYQKALHRLRPRAADTDHPRYFFYLMFWALHTGVFTAGGNEATIEHLPAEKLRRYRFAFPQYEEQSGIAEFLDEQTSRFNSLISAAQRAIDLFQERRSALISAAVTGKIDVRKYTPKEAA
jgi:type I restriction enzyme, S subunit